MYPDFNFVIRQFTYCIVRCWSWTFNIFLSRFKLAHCDICNKFKYLITLYCVAHLQKVNWSWTNYGLNVFLTMNRTHGGSFQVPTIEYRNIWAVWTTSILGFVPHIKSTTSDFPEILKRMLQDFKKVGGNCNFVLCSPSEKETTVRTHSCIVTHD